MTFQEFYGCMNEMRVLFKLQIKVKHGTMPNWIEYSYKNEQVLDFFWQFPDGPDVGKPVEFIIEKIKNETGDNYSVVSKTIDEVNKDDIRKWIEEAVNNIRIEEMEKV